MAGQSIEATLGGGQEETSRLVFSAMERPHERCVIANRCNEACGNVNFWLKNNQRSLLNRYVRPLALGHCSLMMALSFLTSWRKVLETVHLVAVPNSVMHSWGSLPGKTVT